MNEQPEKLREIPEEWRKHIAETRQQLAHADALVISLQGRIYDVRLEQEQIHKHLSVLASVLGGGMNNPRISADGSSIEGD